MKDSACGMIRRKGRMHLSASAVSPNAAYFLPEAKPLEVRKLACAFFECSLYLLNSDQMRHKGGSKLPHSKAPSARDRKTMRH